MFASLFLFVLTTTIAWNIEKCDKVDIGSLSGAQQEADDDERTAVQFRMISMDQDYHHLLGSTVQFHCQFSMHDFRLFNNPIIWTKWQPLVDAVTKKDGVIDDVTLSNLRTDSRPLKINMNSVIKEPFLSTNRYNVTFVNRHPIYNLILSITDLRPEDTGNYSCQVRSRHSTVLLQSNYSLTVIDPVKAVSLIGPFVNVTESTLHVVAGQPSTLQCTVISGLPPPHVDLFIDHVNVSSHFQLTRQYQISKSSSLPEAAHSKDGLAPVRKESLVTSHAGDVVGMRSIEVVTTMSTKLFTVRAGDDGLSVYCIARQLQTTLPSSVTSSSLLPTTTEDWELSRADDIVTVYSEKKASLMLIVSYSPLIYCNQPVARVGQFNVCIRCVVDARPPVTSVYWIEGRRNETSQWTVTRAIDSEQIETALCLLKTRQSDFRLYTVIAVNALQATKRDVTLLHDNVQRRPSRPRKPSEQLSLKTPSASPVIEQHHENIFAVAAATPTSSSSSQFESLTAADREQPDTGHQAHQSSLRHLINGKSNQREPQSASRNEAGATRRTSGLRQLFVLVCMQSLIATTSSLF